MAIKLSCGVEHSFIEMSDCLREASRIGVVCDHNNGLVVISVQRGQEFVGVPSDQVLCVVLAPMAQLADDGSCIS